MSARWNSGSEFSCGEQLQFSCPQAPAEIGSASPFCTNACDRKHKDALIRLVGVHGLSSARISKDFVPSPTATNVVSRILMVLHWRSSDSVVLVGMVDPESREGPRPSLRISRFGMRLARPWVRSWLYLFYFYAEQAVVILTTGTAAIIAAP